MMENLITLNRDRVTEASIAETIIRRNDYSFDQDKTSSTEKNGLCKSGI